MGRVERFMRRVENEKQSQKAPGVKPTPGAPGSFLVLNAYV
jgi:hypothetical protein